MKCKICTNKIPKYSKRFCSYVCFQKHSAKTRRVYLTCKNCKKEYWVKKCDYKKNGSSFCSMKCKVKYGHIEITCASCGKKNIIFRSWLLGKRKVKYNYCSKRCVYDHKAILSLGANNPNYRNGSRKISRVIRGLYRYLKWKKAVIERDNHTCRLCKQKFPFKKLIAHHKIRLWKLIEDYPNKKIDVNDEYFYDLKNGMTLCEPCHGTTYGKDEDDIE